MKEDIITHAPETLGDIQIAVPDDGHALSGEKGVPFPVLGNAGIVIMLRAVQLDDKI